MSQALHPLGFNVLIAFDKISIRVMTVFLWWRTKMVPPSIGLILKKLFVHS